MRIAADHPGTTTIALTVRSLLRLTDEAFALQLDRTSGQQFVYQAGQFAMLTVHDKQTGEVHRKALSFSSTPQDAETLEFGFERRGFFTQGLAKLAPGDTVTVQAPLGDFGVPDDTTDPLVMIAGGTGISPVISMLRDSEVCGRTNPITLLYSISTVEDIMFRTALEQLVKTHPGWRMQYMVTQGEPLSGMLRGRITRELLQERIPDITAPLYLLCGALDMVQDLIRILTACGVDRDRILTEQYD